MVVVPADLDLRMLNGQVPIRRGGCVFQCLTLSSSGSKRGFRQWHMMEAPEWTASGSDWGGIAAREWCQSKNAALED